jgi:CrcB protein
VTRAETALSWVAVAVGGLAGTGLRLAFDTLIPHRPDAFAWSTVIVNTLGAFALGWLAAGVWHRVPEWVRAGLGAGLLGSFTTFSALALSAVMIAEAGPLATGALDSVQPGDWMLAAVEIVGSIFSGLLAALIGILVGRRQARGPRRDVLDVLLDDEEDA